MLNILKDIQNGALPAREIPGFALWLLRKSFWFWFAVIAAAFILIR